jgi:hypothetical protein
LSIDYNSVKSNCELKSDFAPSLNKLVPQLIEGLIVSILDVSENTSSKLELPSYSYIRFFPQIPQSAYVISGEHCFLTVACFFEKQSNSEKHYHTVLHHRFLEKQTISSDLALIGIQIFRKNAFFTSTSSSIHQRC